MKKIFTQLVSLSVIFTLSTLFTSGQSIDRAASKLAPSVKSNLSLNLNSHSVSQFRRVQPSQNTVQNLWDVQFNYNLTPASLVGCVYTGTEFWVSRWNTDTMYTLDNTGAIT